MHKALKMVEECYDSAELKINPVKISLVSFNRKRNFRTLTPLVFYQQHLQIVQDVSPRSSPKCQNRVVQVNARC